MALRFGFFGAAKTSKSRFFVGHSTHITLHRVYFVKICTAGACPGLCCFSNVLVRFNQAIWTSFGGSVRALILVCCLLMVLVGGLLMVLVCGLLMVLVGGLLILLSLWRASTNTSTPTAMILVLAYSYNDVIWLESVSIYICAHVLQID